MQNQQCLGVSKIAWLQYQRNGSCGRNPVLLLGVQLFDLQPSNYESTSATVYQMNHS